MKTDKAKPRKTVIRWTEEEWDKLAELVLAMRRNSPDAIATLANRAQKQFPKTRQRPGILTTAALKPLIDRVQRQERELQQKAEKCDELAAKLSFHEGAPSTREEILETLDDDELCSRFLPRLLQIAAPVDIVSAFNVETLFGAVDTADLAGLLAKRLVIDLVKRPINVTVQVPESRPASRGKVSQNGQNGKNGQSINGNGRKKRVVIVGTKGDQPRRLQEKIGATVDLTCIEVEKLHKDAVPRNADHVILWSKFVSHHHRRIVFDAVEPGRVSEHFAGLTELTEFIEDFCGLTVVA